MEIRAVKFRVGHEWRVGGLYYPQVRAPGPAVLMLHGFPGVQQNEDMAAELCRRGMTAFLPRFAGCWGSGGRFGLLAELADARAALKLLRRYRHVDGRRVAVLGYSLGGWAALQLAAIESVAACALMAPVTPRFDHPEDREYLRRNARVVQRPELGAVWDEYLGCARALRPGQLLARVAPTPLLFVQGLRDRMASPSTTLALWALAKEPKRHVELPGEDHEFQADRAKTIKTVCDWLQTRLSASASLARA